MHSLPKAGQSCGFLTPLSTMPLMQTDGSWVSISVDLKQPFGVMVAELIPQPVAAFRDRANAAPFPVADLEDFVDQVLSDAVAFPLDDARVLVLHFCASPSRVGALS